MRNREFFNYSRRALLGASGALALFAALRPLPIFAQASGGKLRIGIVGSGHIGGTIGGLWVKAGHPVLFSSRHPEELKELVAGLGPLAQNGTVAQAIAFGDALLFAVPYGALPQLGRDYGGALQGKIVLDACNAVAARDGVIADEVEREGIGITSQKYLPGTHLVRAFNTLSYSIFVREANRPDPKLAIPIAGDDGEALAVAARLVREAGFEPVVVGKLVDARRFQRGGPGYGQSVTAAELRQKLSLTP
jgi:8-hydroxy-5-deazaflavin:NADPH oxidoreductase